MKNKITAQWQPCSNEKIMAFGYTTEMVVVESNHPRFTRGTRFDFGFLRIATDEGYSVEILPQN